VLLLIFDVDARDGRPGFGANHIFVRSSGEVELRSEVSLLERCLMESSFRRSSRFAGTARGFVVFLNTAWGLKLMAMGLDPKPAIARGVRSRLILLVLPASSSMLWRMALGLVRNAL
jgi:ABC-type uncharacterized transport system permease subunit